MNDIHGMARQLDLARLRVFHEATRSGSYTAAARRLHVTQSAVSHAIRSLEESVGGRLVEWRQRQFTLTDEGEYLQRVCQRVFRDLDEAEHVLDGRSSSLAQVVTVGA